MSNFDEDGFLHGSIERWILDLKKENPILVADAERLNRMCHQFLNERSVKLDDPMQLIVAVLFARIVELYQAVLILASRGMRSASALAFRALIEAYFHFCAIRDDEKYLEEFLDQFHVDRHRLGGGIARSESKGLAELREYFTAERVEGAKRAKEEAGAKKITTEAAAKRGGNEGIYRTAYALLSAEVHTSVRSLESDLEWDEELQMIKSLRYGPDGHDFVRSVGLSTILLCEVYEGTCRAFSEEVPSEVEEMRRRHTKLLESA